MSQPIISMFCGGSASSQLYEMSTYCGLSYLPLGQTYLDLTKSWASGMWSNYYINVIATAQMGLVTIPMLVGPQPSATLSSGLSTSGAITSLPVAALPATGGLASGSTLVPTGTKLALTSGSNTQVFTTTAPGLVGDTSIAVSSTTPNYSYNSGQKVVIAGVTVSPNASTDHGGNTAAPTVMTLTDIAGGVWDYNFTKAFQTIATYRQDAILRIGWELYGNYWYPWNGVAVASQHVAAYQRLVTLAKTVSSRFSFDWNGGSSQNGYNPMVSAYPGDSYVDYISTDTYDISSPYGNNGWTYGTLPNSLTPGYNFALAHSKPFCIPEFGFSPDAAHGGYGGGDDPAWIQKAFDWITKQPNIGYALFFDSNAGGATPLSGVEYPNGAALTAKLISKYAKRSINTLNGNRFVLSTTGHTRPIVDAH